MRRLEKRPTLERVFKHIQHYRKYSDSVGSQNSELKVKYRGVPLLASNGDSLTKCKVLYMTDNELADCIMRLSFKVENEKSIPVKDFCKMSNKKILKILKRINRFLARIENEGGA